MDNWGQLITLSMIAIALAMDAFSLGVGLGFRNLPKKKVVFLSGLIGLFHVLFPLCGMALGQLLSNYMREIAALLGGGMLCFLGIHMIWNSFNHNEIAISNYEYSWKGLFLFALSVSIDSLSAGLSLGFFVADQWIAVLLCGLAGVIMASMGIGLGRIVGSWLGRYGEVFGGTTLLLLGVKFLW